MRAPPPAEIVPEPEAGRVFERSMRPGIADVAPSGRARLDAIARWLQDIAYLDVVDAGFEDRCAWIVRRTRIRAEALPEFGQDLVLRTFCSGIGRFCAERRTSIAGPGAAVEAVATWVALDPERLVPTRFDEEFASLYGESAGDRGASTRLRHPGPPPDAKAGPWSFRPTDLDVAGHVNNSHYWAALESDLAAGADPGPIDAEVEHLAPGLPGEATILRCPGWAWVADPGGSVLASIRCPSGA
jgi:acyl-ACP thioesterase